jgi:hypothetical protein
MLIPLDHSATFSVPLQSIRIPICIKQDPSGQVASRVLLGGEATQPGNTAFLAVVDDNSSPLALSPLERKSRSLLVELTVPPLPPLLTTNHA